MSYSLINGEPVITQSEHGQAPKWKKTKRLPEIAAASKKRHSNLNQNMTNEI